MVSAIREQRLVVTCELYWDRRFTRRSRQNSPFGGSTKTYELWLIGGSGGIVNMRG
jgi:hypothetical protein